MNGRTWSDFELAVLRMHYPITTAANLAELLDRQVSSVHRKANKLGLAKREGFAADLARERMTLDHPARAHVFPKGHAPANKGLRRPGWSVGDMARTQFKKGQVSVNTMPIGSYRVNSDGFVERKFAQAPGPYMNRWIPLHREIWIAANGPVPKGFVIAFKPGLKTIDPELVTLDRIECISLADNCRRNSSRNHGPEIAKIVQLRGAITRQINKRLKESQ